MPLRKTHTNLLLAYSATGLTAFLFIFLFFTIGIRNRKYTYEDSKALAREISHNTATETELYLSSALATAQSMAEKALIYKKLRGSRNDITNILQKALDGNPNFMGAWTMWEPDAYDNMDRHFSGDTLYDVNGSMAAAFFKHKNGTFFERNDPGDYNEDFYTQPLKTRRELILDPFFYRYHGYDYTFYQTSAVVPVIVDSVFLGVFGIDINLDSLQHKYSSVRLFETGFLSLITGSGIIVSHIDTSLIDRNFYAIINPRDRESYAPLTRGQELTLEVTSEYSGKPVFRFFYPVQVGSGSKPWFVMVEIPINKATVRSHQLLNVAYGILILGLLLLVYLVANIYDRRRYEKNILDYTDKIEESNRIVSESERNFRNIFDQSKDVMIIVGADTRILAANKAFTAVSGYTVADKPLYISDIILSDHQNPIKERLSILSEDDHVQPFEYKVKLKDGQVIITESQSTIIDYYNQQAFLIILRDVTQIREAEHKVMEAIINTEENERSRISQDLHDGLGPVLSTIKIYFQVYQDTQDQDKKDMLSGKLKNTIEEAIKGISEISHNISPHVLRNYGFYAALKQFIHRITITNVINIKLEIFEEPMLSQNTGITLYRTITELLNNSIKHAACSNILISLRHYEGVIEVIYSDDGNGFDVDSVIGKTINGSGVQNIINRIQALKGMIDFSSTLGEGMHARLRVPI